MFKDLEEEIDRLTGGDAQLDFRKGTRLSIQTRRLPSRLERNWQKKNKGAPPPAWASDIAFILTIAANWYDLSMVGGSRKGWQRFGHLLEAMHQHFYNGKRPESALPKDDPRRKQWEAHRAKCRVEWQRLKRFGEALLERVSRAERDTGTRFELMNDEEKVRLKLKTIAAHAPKPGRKPAAILITEWDRKLYQARFDAMMSGKRPVDVAALLTSPPQESELAALMPLTAPSVSQKTDAFIEDVCNLMHAARAVGYDAELDTTTESGLALDVKLD